MSNFPAVLVRLKFSNRSVYLTNNSEPIIFGGQEYIPYKFLQVSLNHNKRVQLDITVIPFLATRVFSAAGFIKEAYVTCHLLPKSRWARKTTGWYRVTDYTMHVAREPDLSDQRGFL